jgi:hypothetical protein
MQHQMANSRTTEGVGRAGVEVVLACQCRGGSLHIDIVNVTNGFGASWLCYVGLAAVG